MAAAILFDRLLHHATDVESTGRASVLSIIGDSYRIATAREHRYGVAVGAHAREFSRSHPG